ncbi:MAG: PVC-type heme-binding CxxCH protein [Limisphaerales bacterium]
MKPPVQRQVETLGRFLRSVLHRASRHPGSGGVSGVAASNRGTVGVAVCVSFFAGVAFPVFAASPSPTAGFNPAPQESYELHPDLELSLFACEPDVVDPVALTFDEFGRAYVVEMRDYPYGFGSDRKPGGTVRLLEDADGDGRVDRSVVFAEGLSFPTSVLAWDGGVLVMAPPEVVFLKDTDGDGLADRRETVVSGLRLGVTDSNASGLRWAFDNWVHAVNGGNGGRARLDRFGRETVELGDRDFRFHPDSGRLERTFHTGGGFGLVFDDWGRSFTPHNINHMQQRVADADAFSRLPGLPPVETTHSISDHGDMARIFAVSTAVTRPNHPEQAGYFSSSGGMGYLGHRGWPGDLPGSVFVCDVVGNLVHRDVLSADGPILKASRAPSEQTREFFASRDANFRPTGVELGPDGALYLLDMQRDVIEHPDYIPRNRLEKLDLRAGQDRGRIYRIAPRGWPRSRELPGKVSPAERVALLASSNQWTRLTAQRLLVGNREKAVVPNLEHLADGPDALGRLHALWTLSGLDALSEGRLERALMDPVAEVRASAVQLAPQRFPASTSVRKAVIERVADEAAHVRFAALLALGEFHVKPSESPVTALQDLLWKDRSAPWMRRAALAAFEMHDERRAASEWMRSSRVRGARDGDALAAVRELADLVGARMSGGDGPALVPILREVLATDSPDLQIPIRLAFLEGLASGLERGRQKPALPGEGIAVLQAALDPSEPGSLAAVWRLTRAFGVPDTAVQRDALTAARRLARDPSMALDRRLESLGVVDFGDPAESVPVLLGLIDSREPRALQQAALELLRHHREPLVGEGLVRAWAGLSPSLRAPVVNLLVYRPTFHPALLSALEAGDLQLGELNLDLEHRRQLLRRATPEIRARAARFMTDDEYSNRKSLVDETLAILPASGVGARGRPIFERICAQCHKVGALGHEVGPDLTGVGHRSVEDLLSNILDPNMAINPSYVGWTAELEDGETETGILVAENAEAITLVQASERRVSLPRSRLKGLKSEGKSLMPDGLEAGLSPGDLRDLIAFLQETPIPTPSPSPSSTSSP